MNPQQKTPQPPKPKIFEHQVGGLTVLLRSADSTHVYKPLQQKQYLFYNYIKNQHISHPHYQLSYFIPVCYGIMVQHEVNTNGNNDDGELDHLSKKMEKWYQDRIRKRQKNQDMGGHRVYLDMANFSHRYAKLNLIDIKIGRLWKTDQTKKIIKINGILKTSNKGDTQFTTRDQVKQITHQPTIQSLLSNFFTVTPGPLLIQLIQSFISRLQDLSLVLRSFSEFSFNSTSICMLYDTDNPEHVWDLKLVDFQRIQRVGLGDGYDGKAVYGIDYIIGLLKGILDQPEKYQNAKLSSKSTPAQVDNKNPV